jgi:beta-phosphoglucomutase-like phosphatase (HAD superfamily)
MSRAGKTVELTVQELNAELGLALDPAIVIAAQREAYEERLDSVEPLLEVLEFARECVSRQQPVSVASGGEAATVARTLHTIQASELFSIVITAADVTHGKPAPDMFLLAAERMRVPPEQCLVLEDSQLGILAAERAGMGALLVGRQQAPEKYR